MAKPKVTVEPFVARADLAGPAPQPEEKLEIDIGHGIKKTIYRGKANERLSDELWAKLQERTKKELSDKQAEQDKLTEKYAVPAVAETGKFGDTEFSESDVEAVKKMRPDIAAKFINERIRSNARKEKQGVGGAVKVADTKEKAPARPAPVEGGWADESVPSNTPQNVAPAPKGPVTRDPEGQSIPVTKQRGENRTITTPEGDELELQGSVGLPRDGWASNGLDPRALGGSVANMAMGATPYSGLASDGAGGGAGATDGQGPGANPGPYPEPSANVPLAPPGQGWGIGVPDVMGTLDNALSPAPPPASVDAGVPTEVVQTPVEAPPPASGSASVGIKMPTVFKVEKPDPKFQAAADEALLKKAATISDAQDQVAALEIARDGAVRVAATESAKRNEEAAKMAQLATQARLDSINESRRYQAASLAMMERAREAAATPTDPNRYWNNKDAGQKAAGIISGALFGFTGQGMQWLQRVDALVAQDNQLQVQDRASRVAGMREEGQALGEAGRQALALGASQAEAHLIERQTKLEGLRSYLEMMTMKTNNMDAKMRGQQMLVELAGVTAKDFQQGADLAQQNADRKTEWNYKNAVLGQQAATASARVGGEGEQSLKPVQEEALSEMLNLGDRIGEMAAQWKAQAGGPMSAVTSNLGLGMQFTDASQWKGSSQKFHAQTIGKPLEGGRMTDADFPKYLEGFIPAASDTEEAARNKTKNLVKYAVGVYRNKLKTLDAGYVKTRRLPSVEQYEQTLRQKAGLVSDVKPKTEKATQIE